MFQDVVNFIKNIYDTDEFISLHEPRFIGHEKQYLNDCIDSTFVSSVGKFVDQFEQIIAQKMGIKYAVATSNGTSALHMCLILADVNSNDEVITQPLTFIATCNAITYIGAKPIFVDVDLDTMGLSPESLEAFLQQNCTIEDGQCHNKTTGRIIKACIPMHTFGHPCKIDEINQICQQWSICLIEDAAESLGSTYKGQHTGTFGKIAAISFNGNKIITSGGGGVIVTNNEELAKRAKHLTTTAKMPHKWEFDHDEIGYNYRMPNLNAALLVAQLEQLAGFVENKRQLAVRYQQFFAGQENIQFISEPKHCRSNYWLQSVLLENREQRNQFLDYTNEHGVMTRPIWKLMNKVRMFKNSQCANLQNSEYLEQNIVNISSSVTMKGVS
ncbi:MAG: LegC family aminotransferase [Rhizobiales bacterium]|nr:LegC family aminotransferase [Hyphomicrobiales bacterium]